MHTVSASTRRQLVNLWLTLLIIWLIANHSLSLEVILTGAVITGILAVVFAPFSGAYAAIRWSPRILFSALVYFAVFLEELVRANINVLVLVLSPRINIEPGIVEIQTTLKSPIGRLVLANSITLTPGTLAVDIKGDTLFIHWINVSSKDPVAATREIAGRFEKYLKVIYG